MDSKCGDPFSQPSIAKPLLPHQLFMPYVKLESLLVVAEVGSCRHADTVLGGILFTPQEGVRPLLKVGEVEHPAVEQCRLRRLRAEEL